MVRTFFLFFALLVIVSCTHDDSIAITGKVIDFKSNVIFVEKREGLGYVNIDTAFIQNDSTFHINIRAESYGYYRLNFNYANRVPLMVGKNDMQLTVDASHLHGDYTVKGSPDHDLKDEIEEINKNFISLEPLVRIKKQYREASGVQDHDTMKKLEARYQRALEEKNTMIKEIILEGINKGGYLGATEVLYSSAVDPVEDAEFYREVANILLSKIPDEPISKEFKGYVSVVLKSSELKKNG